MPTQTYDIFLSDVSCIDVHRYVKTFKMESKKIDI